MRPEGAREGDGTMISEKVNQNGGGIWAKDDKRRELGWVVVSSGVPDLEVGGCYGDIL
jgi:hypothetical protein